jgi:hypothetical protein
MLPEVDEKSSCRVGDDFGAVDGKLPANYADDKADCSWLWVV